MQRTRFAPAALAFLRLLRSLSAADAPRWAAVSDLLVGVHENTMSPKRKNALLANLILLGLVLGTALVIGFQTPYRRDFTAGLLVGLLAGLLFCMGIGREDPLSHQRKLGPRQQITLVGLILFGSLVILPLAVGLMSSQARLVLQGGLLSTLGVLLVYSGVQMWRYRERGQRG